VLTLGSRGETDTDSGGCDNDALDGRTFGTEELNNDFIGISNRNTPVFYSGFEDAFRAVYGRYDDI